MAILIVMLIQQFENIERVIGDILSYCHSGMLLIKLKTIQILNLNGN